ncbi:unnamed protein product [Gadus morhua 'NCC']
MRFTSHSHLSLSCRVQWGGVPVEFRARCGDDVFRTALQTSAECYYGLATRSAEVPQTTLCTITALKTGAVVPHSPLYYPGTRVARRRRRGDNDVTVARK